MASTIAHFKCNKCNQVHPIQLDDIKDILKDKLGENWETKSIEIIYSGHCNNCYKKDSQDAQNNNNVLDNKEITI